LKSFFVAVDRECRALADIEGTDIVESQDVVGVPVGQQDGVQAIQARAKRLLAEVRSRIDDGILTMAGEQQGRTQALVTWITGAATAARAFERRDAHGRAGA